MKIMTKNFNTFCVCERKFQQDLSNCNFFEKNQGVT